MYKCIIVPAQNTTGVRMLQCTTVSAKRVLVLPFDKRKNGTRKQVAGLRSRAC